MSSESKQVSSLPLLPLLHPITRQVKWENKCFVCHLKVKLYKISASFPAAAWETEATNRQGEGLRPVKMFTHAMPRLRCSVNQQEVPRDAEPSSTSPKHLAKNVQSLLWYLAFQSLTGDCNWGSDLESHIECFASAKNLVAGMHSHVYLYLAREHFESSRFSHDIWSTEA